MDHYVVGRVAHPAIRYPGNWVSTIDASNLAGESERRSYRLEGRKFTLKDSDGETSHYQRIP